MVVKHEGGMGILKKMAVDKAKGIAEKSKGFAKEMVIKTMKNSIPKEYKAIADKIIDKDFAKSINIKDLDKTSQQALIKSFLEKNPNLAENVFEKVPYDEIVKLLPNNKAKFLTDNNITAETIKNMNLSQLITDDGTLNISKLKDKLNITLPEGYTNEDEMNKLAKSVGKIEHIANKASMNFKFIFVIILICANFFTYRTFKDVDINKKTKAELALMYVVSYVYTLIYIMLLLYVIKWSGYISSMIFGVVVDEFDEGISLLMRESFTSTLYVLPIYIVCAILSYSLDVNIMYGNDKKYSPYFQAYSFALVIILTFILQHKANIEDEQLIRFLVISITGMSLLQNSLPTNSSGTIERIISSIVNFFINFNWNIVFILLPFILFSIGAVSLVLNPLFFLVPGSLIAVAIFGFYLLQIKFNEQMTTLHKIIFDNVLLKSFLTWILTIIVYSLPLFIMSFVKTGEVTKIVDVFLEIFNKKFANVLAVFAGVLYIFKTFLKIPDEKMRIILNLCIVLILLITKK